MRKCPRCGHELHNDEKYCPHCGLDLQGRYIAAKKKNKPLNFILYILVFCFFAFIPLLYTLILGGLDIAKSPISNQVVALPDMEEKDARMVLASYDTLADFKNSFTNVDNIVEKISNYEKELTQDGKYIFDKTYSIQVLDNYNIYFSLRYEVKINNELIGVIERKFDRAHQYNNEVFYFKKTQVKDFEGLFFDENEMNIVYSFTGSQNESQTLMDNFKHREEEFNSKKKTLGHYGIGEYDGNNSFVVYRQDDTFYSKITYTRSASDYLV